MSTSGSYLYANGSYLHDVGRLAEKLVKDFGALTYEKFAEDSRKVESAVMSPDDEGRVCFAAQQDTAGARTD